MSRRATRGMAERESQRSGNVWVLDTETKGTGANMVPLDRVLRKAGSDPEPEFVFRKATRPTPEPPPARAREFKIVDVMSREVLAEHVDATAAVHVLEGVRSVVDVTVYLWDHAAEQWRMLTLGETRALWEYRGAV